MIVKILLPLLGLVIAWGVSLAYRLGAFKPVDIQDYQMPSTQVLGQEHIGAFYKIVPKIQEVETWAKVQNIPCKKTFGQYFDDPRTIEEDRLRSFGGCVLESPLTTVPEKYKVSEIPPGTYVKLFFTGSPSIGPYKVYPKALEWITSHGYELSGPIIEVYEVISETEMNTEYFFPYRKK